ncbi:MAG: HAMP domain-containing histidine kinase, partial [Flavobacteriaceae bacterium]|nr:HAMP domain-containing histidine kinase [Flavobacteriaceae bacterium]
ISKQFLDLAFDYYKKHDDATKISQLYAIYINYYNTINQLDLSEKANQDRIDYLKTKGDTLQLANAIMTYGNFKLQKQKDCQGALKLYELAESLYTTVLKGEPYNNYRRLVQGMASCYATLNDYKKAYEYSELAYDLRNALNKQYNQDLSLKLETKYQTKEKEQEIALLKAKNELVEKQKSNQRNLLLAAILFTTMMGIFFFFLYRNRKKTATKLKELDNFKSRFFANISHEFRTPLTLISGLIDKSLAFENSDNLDKNELQIMQRNSNRLLNLVNQLLDVSKLESGNLKLNVSPGDLGLLIKAIGSSFQHIANQKSIQYTIDVAEMKNVWFDHDIIEKITTNLLQNA